MAGQNNKNVIEYEFAGNLLPLEKAFDQAGKLFKRYIREARKASKEIDPKTGKPKEGAKATLDADAKLRIKTIKGYYEQLRKYSERYTRLGNYLSPEDHKKAHQIYRNLLLETKKFGEDRKRLMNQQTRDIKKAKKEEEEAAKRDYTSTASQFKAQVQSEQLGTLIREVPRLDPNVISDINSYIVAWQRAKTVFDGSAESTEALAEATKTLDQKARDYIPTLKALVQNQKKANSVLEAALNRIIAMVTSFEFWIRKIKEGIEYLGEYVEALNFLEVATRNIKWKDLSDGVDKASEAFDNLKDSIDQARWSLGLNATDMATAEATFISFANAMNIADKDVEKFSQNMTQLSIDMASLQNKEVIVMMTAFRSALAGNTRAMMNYGISVHDATLNEWLLSQGINKQMTNLSESSQMMVRYAYIMTQLSHAQGDLARTLKSPSNQIKVLKNQVQLLTQNLGSLFNLVVYPAIRILNAILIPLNAFITSMTALANDKYSAAISNTASDVDDLSDSLDDASDAAKGLSGIDEINQLSAGKSKVDLGVDSAIQELVDGISVYDSFLGKTSKLTQLMKTLGDVLAPIWNMLSNTFVLDALSWSIDAVGYALKPIQMILDTIKSGYENMPSWLQKICDVIGAMAGGLASLATTIIIVNAAMNIFKKLMAVERLQNFVSVLKDTWKAFIRLGEALYTAIAKMVTWIATTIKARIEAIKTSIAQNGLATSFKLVAINTGKAIINFFKYIAGLIAIGAKAVFATIKNLLLSKSLWGVALGAIAAAGIGAIAVAGIVGTAVAIGNATKKSSEADTDSTQVQGLATGGVVSRPTFAMIGEGQYNEAVVPLGNSPQFKVMQESIAERVVERQRTYRNNVQDLPSRPIVLSIDGRELGRAQINDISQVRRQVGVGVK